MSMMTQETTVLDRPPARPVFAQVADHYECLIRGGTLKPGDRLPYVLEMAALWEIAPPTAHRVAVELRRRGLIYTRRGDGGGSFVGPEPAPPEQHPRPEPVYVYKEIAAHYAGLITSGTLKPGDRLPSYLAIAAAWHVAPHTARRAMRDLKLQGLVYIEPTNGTYVAPPPAPPQ